MLRGPAQNPDVYFQARETVNPFYDGCSDITQQVMDAFAARVTAELRAHPRIRWEEALVAEVAPGRPTLIATGPLTAPPLAEAIRAVTGQDGLAFFDAIAPIVHKDSIDFSKAWLQSRYDKGTGSDYVNCPLTHEQYDLFIDGLLEAEKVAFHDWEMDTPYFEGCLPIEVMASRGRQTLAFGPMKPVGLTNPFGPKPHAIIQLRQDNALGTLYNMVGFQTKLRHGDQVRLFRTIPGLEGAEFARLGGMHRNTFVNGPRVLDPTLRLKAAPWLRLAGQITGCEGYVESSGIGLLAGRFAVAEARGVVAPPPPLTTALGALLGHVTGLAEAETYQPMNVNFGLFPPPPERDENGRRVKGRDRKKLYTVRALNDLAAWLV